MAHARKSFGGGPPGLGQVLAREGVTDPLWYKVRKNRKASKYTRRATPEGADLRTLGRVAVSGAERSPFVEMTARKAFRIRFDRKLPYELHGGARPAVRDLRIQVHPPAPSRAASQTGRSHRAGDRLDRPGSCAHADPGTGSMIADTVRYMSVDSRIRRFVRPSDVGSPAKSPHELRTAPMPSATKTPVMNGTETRPVAVTK